MIFALSVIDRSDYYGAGYIAGTGNGIATVAGKPESRPIYLYALHNHKPMVLVAKIWSTSKGNYIFTNIDTMFRYLVIARDHKEEFEPFAWDYVQPATDLSVAQQYDLRGSWQ